MTATEPAAPTLPSYDHEFYGRHIGTYGDGEGFVVAGHDRRAWAALSAMAREEYSDRHPQGAVIVRWSVLHTSCGCTEEQHALHGEPPEDLEDAPEEEWGPYQECYEQCPDERRGLPPCDDTYAWMSDHCDEDTPGATPILEYRP